MLLKIGLIRLDDQHPAREIEMLITLNFVLAGLNLIPVPPLDGGTVLAGILPYRHAHVIGFLQQYGFVILLVLLVTNALSLLLSPVFALAHAWLGALQSLA
jgi:Zn-dependent protease